MIVHQHYLLLKIESSTEWQCLDWKKKCFVGGITSPVVAVLWRGRGYRKGRVHTPLWQARIPFVVRIRGLFETRCRFRSEVAGGYVIYSGSTITININNVFFFGCESFYFYFLPARRGRIFVVACR